MPWPRRFSQVDVFGAGPYRGNPVAVVLEAEGLGDGEMAAFADWTNLSETTFVLPPTAPGADYRVRIFTPSRELPFAGHPTLGTCHAWLADHGDPGDRPVVQECGAGLVPIRRIDGRLAFAAPPLLRSGPVEPALVRHLAEVLRIEPGEIVDAQWADNGPGWVAVLLPSAEAVLALDPGPLDLNVGVAGPYGPRAPCAYEVRAFLPGRSGPDEDPVTGSLNASLADWLLGSGRAHAPYVASQGRALGREGRIHLSRDGDGTVWVGGATRTGVDGQVTL